MNQESSIPRGPHLPRADDAGQRRPAPILAAGISDRVCEVPEGWNAIAEANSQTMEEDKVYQETSLLMLVITN
jgi:hypothetical protein